MELDLHAPHGACPPLAQQRAALTRLYPFSVGSGGDLCASANPFPRVDGPNTLGNGEVIQVPSDEEPGPAERDVPLTLPSPVDVIRNVSGPRHMAPMGDTAPNVQTPKRRRGPVAVPATRRARTSRDTDDPPEDAFPNKFGATA